MQQYQTINPLMMPFYTPIIIPPAYTQTDNSLINVGSGSIGGPSPVHVTQVTTPTYTALATDYFLCVDTSVHATDITLPTGILGTVYVIKDCTGDANIHPITINGSGGQLVDGSASGTITAPFGSVSLIFNGTEWSIV